MEDERTGFVVDIALELDLLEEEETWSEVVTALLVVFGDEETVVVIELKVAGEVELDSEFRLLLEPTMEGERLPV